MMIAQLSQLLYNYRVYNCINIKQQIQLQVTNTGSQVYIGLSLSV